MNRLNFEDKASKNKSYMKNYTDCKNKNNSKNKQLNKKYSNVAAILLLGTALLSGCGNKIPDMTPEQQHEVGEYTAITMLKYDANHRSRLVDLSKYPEPTQTPEPEPSADPSPSPTPEVTNNSSASSSGIDNSDSSSAYASISDFLALPNGVTLDYVGMNIQDSYGDTGDFFSLDATSGKKLMVLNFTLKNSSNVSQYIDILNKRIGFRATINGDYTRNSIITVLDNDISCYNDTLEAGQEENVVLIVEIDASMQSNINTVSLRLNNGDETYSINLK